jgi:sulfur-oxidizing protein SoxY
MEPAELTKGRSQGTGAGRPCDRRTFLVAAGALSSAWVLPAGAFAQEQAASWEQAVQAVLGSAKPTEVKMLLEMPEIAENGNTVPFTVSLDNPMTDKDYVKAIHVIATANPQPGVASFYFTPLSGKAAASSRARLARTQDVIAIAELSNGTFVMSKRSVKVTIGGCGGG